MIDINNILRYKNDAIMPEYLNNITLQRIIHFVVKNNTYTKLTTLKQVYNTKEKTLITYLISLY